MATLRAEVSSLILSQETIRGQNERLFQLAVGVVKDGQIPLQTLQPCLLPAELKQVSEQAAASRKESLPIDIDAAYFSSGWMGDPSVPMILRHPIPPEITVEGEEIFQDAIEAEKKRSSPGFPGGP